MAVSGLWAGLKVLIVDTLWALVGGSGAFLPPIEQFKHFLQPRSHEHEPGNNVPPGCLGTVRVDVHRYRLPLLSLLYISIT